MFGIGGSTGTKMESPKDIFFNKKNVNVTDNNADINSGSKQNIQMKRKKVVGGGPVRPRGHRTKQSGSDLNDHELEELNSDIASAFQPFKSSESSESKNSERGITYFTFIVILLPSAIAVVVPLIFPNTNSDFDVANLITDILMIVLVSWFIKFVIEWPWNWLKEIKATKQKLINHTNSTSIINKVSMASSSEIKLNDEILINNILLIKRLMKLETYALLFCLSGTVCGTCLMYFSRSYIIIEESRKNIVFSNLNIGIFIFWELMRLMLTITESLHNSTVNDINDRLKNGNNEYSLITEDTIDMFLPEHLVSKDQNIGMYMRRAYDKMVHEISKKLFSINAGEENDNLKELRLDYELKISLLEEKNKEQNVRIESLLKNQNAEFDRISSSINNLEKSLTTFKSNSSLNEKSPDHLFLKPFPLNLNSENNKSSASSPKEPMNTIFEEEVEHQENVDRSNHPLSISTDATSYVETLFESTSINHPKTSKVSPMEKETKFFSRRRHEPSKKNHFSLHGLPFTSSIKHLITRSVDDSKSIKSYGIHPNINDLVGYDSDCCNSSERNVRDSVSAESITDDTSLLIELLLIFRRFYNRTFLIDILKDPNEFKVKLKDELYLKLHALLEGKFKTYTKNIYLIRSLIWEFANKYFFKNMGSINLYFKDVYQIYFEPLKSAMGVVLIVFTKIPLNSFRIFISVVFFFPKIMIRTFILSNKLSKDNSNSNLVNREEYNGMKEFHLSPTYMSMQEEFDTNRIQKNFRARNLIVNKFAQHYDIESSSVDNIRGQMITPVALYNRT